MRSLQGPSLRLLRRLRDSEGGQSVLEFALVLPVLLLLLLGIVQFGAVFTGLLGLNAAAREGARAAAVGEDVIAAVEQVYPLGLFLQELDPVEDIETKPLGDGMQVTVKGRVNIFVPFLGDSWELKGSAAMRLEQP